MPDYRKLDVYQLACTFSDRVAVAVDGLPIRMRDKADQLRRAADSIHEAISEGCGLGTDAQPLKYLRIALGSANECEDELHTLNRRGLLRERDLDLLEIARRICARLAKFIQRVQADKDREEQKRKRGLTSRRPTTHGQPSRPSREPTSREPASGEPTGRERKADAESRGPQPS